MSGYTKGLWRVSDRPDVYFIHGKDELFVAELVNNSSTAVEANARLIAAAPELLEALKEARYTLIKRGLQESTTFGIVEAAIAKAEGL